MSNSEQPVDVARRIARTIVQTGIPTFIALAAAVPWVLEQAGRTVDPDTYARLVVLAAGITAAAGVLARIMANPTVNRLLVLLKLDAATSTTADTAVVAQTEPDTNTTVVKLSETNSGEFTGTPAY